jgi:hypothetical protein
MALLNKSGTYGTQPPKGFNTYLPNPEQLAPWWAAPTSKVNWSSNITTATLPKVGPPATGTNLIKGQTKQTLPGGTKFSLTQDRQAPNLRPAVDILNYIAANRKIGQIERAQLARKNTFYTAPSLSVRPVTDLPPEILAAQADALSQIRSTDASSDPVMNLIAKNIATAQRDKMRNEQIAGRASAMLQDRNRFDTETRQNQQLAGETANRNLDREQDFADYRTGVKTAALESRAALNQQALSQLGKNIDTAAEYNMYASTVDMANVRQNYQDLLKLVDLEVTPENKEKALIKAKEYWATYSARLIPKFGRAQAGAIDNGFITKLFGQRTK